MRRRNCKRHGPGFPCSCGMGNLYRFVEPVVLYLLFEKGKTHGYELAGKLKDHALTDSEIEPGALYRTLRKLEENGMVTSNWDMSGAGPARRVYELTQSGKDHLEEWYTVLSHMCKQMTRFIEELKVAVDTNKAESET